MMRRKPKETDFALGILIGGVVGAIVSCVLTPKTGRKAHKKIRKQLEEISDISTELVEMTKDIEEKLDHCCKPKE